MSKDKEFFTTFFSIMAGLAIFAVILVILATKLTSGVSEYKPEEVVIENIKPVGEVYIAGESEPEAAPAADAAEPKSGEQVYNSNCLACHGTGAAGAPKLGDKGAWKNRIAQGNDTLIDHAINGFKGMPAKGGNASLSDDAVNAAVEYMGKGSK